jgi:hypothetical protein
MLVIIRFFVRCQTCRYRCLENLLVVVVVVVVVVVEIVLIKLRNLKLTVRSTMSGTCLGALLTSRRGISLELL